MAALHQGCEVEGEALVVVVGVGMNYGFGSGLMRRDRLLKQGRNAEAS
jgi:hypothetical protein